MPGRFRGAGSGHGIHGAQQMLAGRHKGFTMTTTHFDQLQLAERWGLSTATLERWRTNGTGPKYIRLPGKVIYRLCDIEAYENERFVSSTAEFRKHAKLSAI